MDTSSSFLMRRMSGVSHAYVIMSIFTILGNSGIYNEINLLIIYKINTIVVSENILQKHMFNLKKLVVETP